MSETPDAYAMTEKGWAIAEDVWYRFAYEQEDVHAIAASYGMAHEEILILMTMAFQGGKISLD